MGAVGEMTKGFGLPNIKKELDKLREDHEYFRVLVGKEVRRINKKQKRLKSGR